MNAATPSLLLLDKDQLATALGVSVRKVEEAVAEGLLPAPIMCLGPKLPRWPVSDIVECIARMPRSRTVSSPAQLRRGAIDKMKAGVPA